MALKSTVDREEGRKRREAFPVIDTDIHESFSNLKDLVPYLEEPWKGLIDRGGWKGFTQPFVYWSSGADYWSGKGNGEPGDVRGSASDYEAMRDMLLDTYNIERAILTGYFYTVMMGESMQVEFAAALASAYNDFQIEEWLNKDERLRGSIHIAPQNPEAAAREIDRMGSHPQMVQVMLGLGGIKKGFGDPYYSPIFEAAQRNKLVIATHHTVYAEGALGMGRYYIERHMLIPQVTMSTLISFVCNGVFDRFPDLRFAFLEGGFTWLPHVLWRMDREYKSLRQESPWIKKLPSEHIVEDRRIRLATQPTEDISADQWSKVIDLIGSDEILMFATDYPHFDFDSPVRSLPSGMSDELKRKVLYDNAQSLYNF